MQREFRPPKISSQHIYPLKTTVLKTATCEIAMGAFLKSSLSLKHFFVRSPTHTLATWQISKDSLCTPSKILFLAFHWKAILKTLFLTRSVKLTVCRLHLTEFDPQNTYETDLCKKIHYDFAFHSFGFFLNLPFCTCAKSSLEDDSS